MLLAVATALLLVLSRIFRRESAAKIQQSEKSGENIMFAENATTETIAITVRADYFWHAAQFVRDDQPDEGYAVLHGVCVEPSPNGEGVLIYAMDGHQLCCWHDAAGYADQRRVILPTPDMLAIVKPSFTRRGHTPGTLAVNSSGVWLLTRGHTSISGIKAFDIPQNFPELLPFLTRAACLAPSDAPTTLPALSLSRFTFGKLSTCLTITSLDGGSMVSVTNPDMDDFFGLIMGMRLPEESDARDLRAPRFIRRLLGEQDGTETPEETIVVTQPEPETLAEAASKDDASESSETAPDPTQPESAEPRAARKRRRPARRASRRPAPVAESALESCESEAAPLALPESPAPLLPAVIIAAPAPTEKVPEETPQAEAIPLPATPTTEPRARFRTTRSIRRQARRIAPHHAVPASRPATGFPSIAVGLAVMLALIGTVGGRPLELAAAMLSQAFA